MKQTLSQLLTEAGPSYSIAEGELYYRGNPITGAILKGECRVVEANIQNALDEIIILAKEEALAELHAQVRDDQEAQGIPDSGIFGDY